jgi:uncharacterized membrane protein YkvA (DUF1232 family)
MERTYVDYFKDDIRTLEDSGKDFDRSVLYFPDIINLLCSLLDEDSLDRESRMLIHVALGYLLVPNDVVPEDVYGAYGYMDDMYLSCIVLSNIKKKYSDLMHKLWINEEPLEKALDLCIFRSEKFLEEKGLKDKLMRFCGLAD